MSCKITGNAEVLLDGVPLLNKSGATASGIGISGEPAFERKAIVGDTGFHGFVESPVMARCEVTVTDRADISVSDIAKVFCNGTIIFRARGGGKVYIMENATALNNFQLTAGEGELTLAFEGPYWTETTATV